MTAEQAMAELWGTFCPDCGPQDYAGILAEVKLHAPDGEPAPAGAGGDAPEDTETDRLLRKLIRRMAGREGWWKSSAPGELVKLARELVAAGIEPKRAASILDAAVGIGLGEMGG
jgi:hypothetical protein